MAQLTDCNIDEVKIGMEVRLEFRRIQSEGHAGVISYGHKAVRSGINTVPHIVLSMWKKQPGPAETRGRRFQSRFIMIGYG